MFIVSCDTVSAVLPRPLLFGVALQARKEVFICGETEAMVPWTTVPFFSSMVTVSFWHFMRNLIDGGQSTAGQSTCRTRNFGACNFF